MTFLPKPYADTILEAHTIITDINTGIIYIYSPAGYYNSVNSVRILEHMIEHMLGNYTVDYKVNQIISSIRRQTYRNVDRFDPQSNYVCLNNGNFNLETQALEPHDPDKFVTYRIPVDYDQLAPGEDWLKYIESLVDDEDAFTLQEAVGNLFANHYTTKKLLYMYGSKDSGKSTFIEIIQRFLTKANYSNLSLNQLGEKFTNASIYGKRANFFADIPYKVPVRYYGIIKNFTGGDTVTLQFKGQDAFQNQNIAKMFFSGNGIPAIDEKQVDDAFYRRWQFVRFPHPFKPDDSIIGKYTTHEMLSAILNWALEGYENLKEQKWCFTTENSVEEVKEIFNNAVYVKNNFH